MASDNDETGSFYIFLRIVQIITLVVCFGLLSSVVSAYNHAGLPVPSSVECLFIVAILLTVWSICIMITYLRALNVDYTIAVIDFLGMIALIVGVVLLSNAVNGECINLSAAASYAGVSTDQILTFLQNQQSSTVNVDGEQYGRYCGLLKAAWGLGIANIFFFFLTALTGYQIASAFQQKMTKRRSGSRSRTIVEEEIAVPPVVVMQQPAMREYIVAEEPRRKKSSSKKRSSSHRRSGDVGRRDSRRASRSDYYG